MYQQKNNSHPAVHDNILVCMATKIEVKLHQTINTYDKLPFIEEELLLAETRMLERELELYIIKIWQKYPIDAVRYLFSNLYFRLILLIFSLVINYTCYFYECDTKLWYHDIQLNQYNT